MTPAAPDVGIVHRHTDAGEIYFVANTSNQPRNVQAAFRVDGMQPEIWNPVRCVEPRAALQARPFGRHRAAAPAG